MDIIGCRSTDTEKERQALKAKLKPTFQKVDHPEGLDKFIENWENGGQWALSHLNPSQIVILGFLWSELEDRTYWKNLFLKLEKFEVDYDLL